MDSDTQEMSTIEDVVESCLKEESITWDMKKEMEHVDSFVPKQISYVNLNGGSSRAKLRFRDESDCRYVTIVAQYDSIRRHEHVTCPVDHFYYKGIESDLKVLVESVMSRFQKKLYEKAELFVNELEHHMVMESDEVGSR